MSDITYFSNGAGRLKSLTAKENLLRGSGACAKNARKTHCKRGHELSGNNITAKKNGWRVCKNCSRIRANAHYKKISTKEFMGEV